MKQLWAPWRLEYIQSADEQEGCVFCRAREGADEEGLVVHRGKRAFVVLNMYPYASGHLMVAPNRHEGEFGDLEDEEALEVHQKTREALVEDLKAQLADAVERAEAQPPPGIEDVFNDVFAELTPQLKRQREAILEEQRLRGEFENTSVAFPL